MEPARIAELLQPFLGSANDQRLTTNDLQNISTYIDLLLRWNARINLTAIRNEEEMVTRHFGESLFAARHLFPPQTAQCRRERPRSCTLIDVGSGAGFPGLPIKIWAPHIHLTLIESNQKKATFLREVTRSLTLTNINVFAGRAEAYPNPPRGRSNPPRSRTLRNSPPNRRPPGRTRRPPGPPHRPSPATASPQPGSRASLATLHPNPPFRKPRPRHWRQGITHAVIFNVPR